MNRLAIKYGLTDLEKKYIRGIVYDVSQNTMAEYYEIKPTLAKALKTSIIKKMNMFTNEITSKQSFIMELIDLIYNYEHKNIRDDKVLIVSKTVFSRKFYEDYTKMSKYDYKAVSFGDSTMTQFYAYFSYFAGANNCPVDAKMMLSALYNMCDSLDFTQEEEYCVLGMLFGSCPSFLKGQFGIGHRKAQVLFVQKLILCKRKDVHD